MVADKYTPLCRVLNEMLAMVLAAGQDPINRRRDTQVSFVGEGRPVSLKSI